MTFVPFVYSVEQVQINPGVIDCQPEPGKSTPPNLDREVKMLFFSGPPFVLVVAYLNICKPQ